MDKISGIDILDVKVSRFNYETLIQFIKKTIGDNEKKIIAYANADTLNKSSSDADLYREINSFDAIHPDGTGVYLASRFLYGRQGFSNRFAGSDFYEVLIKHSIKEGWKYFFFGHTNEILSSIRLNIPELLIIGYNEGYNYDNDEVINKINSGETDIIIVGLSCPLQEKWMFENKDRINFKIMLAAGDGIKVFAGKKIRGPLIMRKAGLEWLARYASNPVQNFRKYIIGIPVFVMRILIQKLKMKIK